MAQIIRITSEALQATIRRLLPSQQGFGEDLQASNVIMPVIDLTPTAEGSQLATDLARSLSFGSQTEISINNTTATIANTPGFYRFFGNVYGLTNDNITFQLTDGLSTKNIWKLNAGGAVSNSLIQTLDFTVFLDTGESLTGTTNDAVARIDGSVRQIADRYGNIINPSGFTFE